MESKSEEADLVAEKASEWNPFNEQDSGKDEAEWADFSLPTPHTNQLNGATRPQIDDEWTDFVETPKTAQKNPLLNLIENFLINQNNNDINFCENIAENELSVDHDPTWTELRRYTSINDESLSLKFKWSLSSLEDEYLKSLNLHRQLPVQPKKPAFLSSDEILQPVKIDLGTQITESVNQTSPKESVESLDVSATSTLNIDLSFFEQTESENTPKNYLNKLLSEIYTQNGSNGKDEDSDKKSITSVSSHNSTQSNSSNRLSQKSIQLEPLSLEKQFNIINFYHQNKYP